MGNHPYDVKGTSFYYSYDYVYSLGENVSSPNIRLNEDLSTIISITYDSGDTLYKTMRISNNSNFQYVYGNYRGTLRFCGYPCIILGGNNKLYLGGFAERNGDYRSETIKSLLEITDGATTDEDVYVTTNNTTINNNVYNSNYTIIYNEGDTYISDGDDEPLPTTPPGGSGDPGGGGGDDPGGDPDNWNPTTPTIPDPSSPDFPSVELPDIDIPDLPSLNFSLGDLREKFPFSLPFDIIAVLNVLDGEPQAPHIQATVPIGKWYTWEMDFDFSEFDNYARIFRAFEFIGFVIGLAVFTVHFAKG